jgi:hypothetical protein
VTQLEARWTLEYDSDVTRYLYTLRETGNNVRKAIRSLSQGIPSDARRIQDDPETWEWLEARHWITFVVDQARKWIYISDVSSATID